VVLVLAILLGLGAGLVRDRLASASTGENGRERAQAADEPPPGYDHAPLPTMQSAGPWSMTSSSRLSGEATVPDLGRGE
jgi:hypothetical protein